MVSILLGVWNGGGAYCCRPARCSGAGRVLLIPLQCWRVLLSCRAPFHCQVCGVWCGAVRCALFVWWGILCPLPPRRGGGWGHRGWWGGIADGGWHREGRAAVLLVPRRMSASPVCVLVSPLVVYPVALLNGGSGACCDALSSDWVRRLALFYSLSYCPVPLSLFVFAVTALLV